MVRALCGCCAPPARFATERRVKLAWVVLGGVLLAGLARRAPAATLYDPALAWRTLESPHFRVHYPEGAYNQGVRVSRTAEEVLGDVGELFGFRPEGLVDIVLSDNSDLANGSAQVLPRNIMRLFLTAPTELTGLAGAEDWLRILIIHELAHICDIDQTWGMTRLLRHVFGKTIQMNGFVPQFISEGAGVYAETVLTRNGRGRSSYVATFLRMEALEGRFPSIDQANIVYAPWPAGSTAYFYGGLFHLWLAQTYGRDAVRAWHQYNAAMPLPYVYWPGARLAFGKSLPALWEDWRREETLFAAEVQAQVERLGVTPSRRLTHQGGDITGARYSPDGRYIVYSRSSPVDGATVRRVDREGTEDRSLVLQAFSAHFSFRPDGAGFFFAQNAINARFNNFNDIYYYDMKRDETQRLRVLNAPDEALRARDPDMCADGEHLAYVRVALNQSQLVLADVVATEDGWALRPQRTVGPRGDMLFASPRYAPDGALLAVSVSFSGGKRDILLLDGKTGRFRRRVTFDRALDGNPTWTRDGRYLLYESDSDGISNIYAYEVATQRYFRVTRVVGGAFQPDVSPDNRAVLFRSASGVGFDIHEMALAPQNWEAVRYTPEDGYVAAPPVDAGMWTQVGFPPAALPSAREQPLVLAATERDAPYSAWSTMHPGQNNWALLPAVYFLNGDPTAALSLLGQDVLAQHTYTASVGTGAGPQQLNWSLAYANDVWYPTLGVLGSDTHYLLPVDGVPMSRRAWGGQASVIWPWRQRHVAALSYAFQRREPERQSGALAGRDGDFAHLELGYTYGLLRRFPYSISSEHGAALSASLRWYSATWGSDFNELLLRLDGRLFVNNPIWHNHVLALRAVVALAAGPDFRETFLLGGSQGSSLLSLQTDRFYPLRGFLPEAEGVGLAVAYAEYRLPLWHVQKGLWTAPIFVQHLHLGLFVEGGNAFGRGKEENAVALLQEGAAGLRRGRVGAGAELRMDVTWGWAFPLTLRWGIGVPLVRAGRGAFDALLAYWGVGTAF